MLTAAGRAATCKRYHFYSVVAILLSQSAIWPATPRPDLRAPLQAELLIPISAHGSARGKPVYVQALSEWSIPGCNVRTGAILKGRVVATVPHSKDAKTSSIALTFETADCGNKQLKPVPFTLAAIAAVGPALNASAPLNEAIGVSIGEGGGSGGRSAMGAVGAAYSQLAPQGDRPKLGSGDVVGLRGVKLGVGSGPEGSSVIYASGRDVRLERGTQIYLVLRPLPVTNMPERRVATEFPAAPPAIPLVVEAPARPAPPPETDVCSPPDCTIELHEVPATTNATASGIVSLAELGFAPRLRREMYGVDHDAAIAYLGTGELLCTFNPHTLVQRTEGELTARNVRGVLIDTETRTVKRVMDWHIPDDRQYLWRLGRRGVLIHTGDELIVYGPGLKQEHRMTLSGPLAFVRTSPSGRMIALGMDHERHSAELHRQLLEAMDGPPEEDIEVRVVDSDLKMMASWLSSNRVNPPFLSEQGELRLAVGTDRTRYRIMEYQWNRQVRTVTTVHSSCIPTLFSLPDELLVVSGCGVLNAQERWQSVLKANGRALLKRNLLLSEMEHYASGTTNRIFALGTLESSRSMVRGEAFGAADFASERVGIYRAKDGGRLAVLEAPSPLPTAQTVALAPDGDRLAVLTRDGLLFYSWASRSGDQ